MVDVDRLEQIGLFTNRSQTDTGEEWHGVLLQLAAEEIRELRAEIARHHVDFERWEEMAHRGAQRIESNHRMRDALMTLRSWGILGPGTRIANARWAREVIDAALEESLDDADPVN